MIKVLIIVAVSGFLLCTVCIAGAAALGGQDIVRNGWRLPKFDVNVDEDGDVRFTPSDGPRSKVAIHGGDHGEYNAMWEGADETREVAWLGARDIDVGMPADITYTQGPNPKITVTGPRGAIERFYVDGGELRIRGWSASTTFTGRPTAADLNNPQKPPRLKIAIVAPGVSKFELSGTETLTIDGYNQDSLILDMSGASKATVKGTARLSTLDLEGAANADLSGLKLQNVVADLNGGAMATLAPTGMAVLDASDGAHVVLLNRPSQLIRDVSGGAMIDEGMAPVTMPSVPAPAPAKKAG